MSDVEAIKKQQPQAEIYTYADAPHGFHCDERGSYNEAASKAAWPRTMAFLQKNMKK
jgi:carboxymethylenebutenolidase